MKNEVMKFEVGKEYWVIGNTVIRITDISGRKSALKATYTLVEYREGGNEYVAGENFKSKIETADDHVFIMVRDFYKSEAKITYRKKAIGYANPNDEVNGAAEVAEKNKALKKLIETDRRERLEKKLIDEYIVSVESQDAAIEGEIKMANTNNTPLAVEIENNLTVNVLAINGKGKLTLNGKIVTKKFANSELWAAHDGDFSYTYAVLYTDELSINKSGVKKNEIEDGKVKIVDFGRDEVPHVNAKVDAIIAEYRAAAKAEDEEKARREAYQHSDEGRLEDINCKIKFVAESVQWNRDLIKYAQKKIIKLLAEIANKENEINEFSLEVAKFEAELEKFTAEKVQLEAFVAIKAVAAEIEDDGTNDDDETVADTYVEVEDDDNELPDDLIIIKTEYEMTIATANFELNRFGEDYDKSAAEIRTEIDDLKKQIEILQDRLYSKEEELEKKTAEVINWANKTIGSVEKNYSICVNDRFGNRYRVQKKRELYCQTFLNFKLNVEEFAIASVNLFNLARYSTAKEFVNAVTGLVNAINRGDAEYTFPAEK